MDKIEGLHVKASLLDGHSFIANLVYIEGPVVTLMRDDRRNWIYLWCDTDGYKKERYIVQSVDRAVLLSYLQKTLTLRGLIESNDVKFLLDVTSNSSLAKNSDSKRNSRDSHRYLKRVSDISTLSGYLPSDDSYFDEELSPDVNLTNELAPTRYAVDILGDWFVTDLSQFSAVYEQIYDFLYCTAPRFVTNIGERIRGCLHAPWTGGFSRVHLFRALKQFVPSLHDLRVQKISYASPGQIEIEALPSVGKAITDVVARYLVFSDRLKELENKVDKFLAQALFKRQDLSLVSDSGLALPAENRKYLESWLDEISKKLQCTDEMSRINEYSPNIIVSAKVTLAFLTRVRRLAKFQNAGLVQFTNAPMTSFPKAASELFDI